MTPADRAAAILAELEATPEVAVLVAEGIGNFKIARGWNGTTDDAVWVRRTLSGDLIAEARWMVGWPRQWYVLRPSVGGPCASVEDGVAQADAVLRERGWRLM